jgi:hypothetical protein
LLPSGRLSTGKRSNRDLLMPRRLLADSDQLKIVRWVGVIEFSRNDNKRLINFW